MERSIKDNGMLGRDMEKGSAHGITENVILENTSKTRSTGLEYSAVLMEGGMKGFG